MYLHIQIRREDTIMRGGDGDNATATMHATAETLEIQMQQRLQRNDKHVERVQHTLQQSHITSEFLKQPSVQQADGVAHVQETARLSQTQIETQTDRPRRQRRQSPYASTASAAEKAAKAQSSGGKSAQQHKIQNIDDTQIRQLKEEALMQQQGHMQQKVQQPLQQGKQMLQQQQQMQQEQHMQKQMQQQPQQMQQQPQQMQQQPQQMQQPPQQQEGLQQEDRMQQFGSQQGGNGAISAGISTSTPMAAATNHMQLTEQARYIYMYVCECIHVYACICTYNDVKPVYISSVYDTCIYMHTHIHTYTHTHQHTYTHTCKYTDICI
jgi:hypothetical protein